MQSARIADLQSMSPRPENTDWGRPRPLPLAPAIATEFEITVKRLTLPRTVLPRLRLHLPKQACAVLVQIALLVFTSGLRLSACATTWTLQRRPAG
jgi:hypothetical protein